jgi:hypothetical protein
LPFRQIQPSLPGLCVANPPSPVRIRAAPLSSTLAGNRKAADKIRVAYTLERWNMQWTINPLHKTNPEGPLVGPTCRVGHELADGVTEFCDAQRKSRPAGGTYSQDSVTPKGSPARQAGPTRRRPAWPAERPRKATTGGRSHWCPR